MSAPAPKTPRFWFLASVTYGAVIAVTILSVLAYRYLAPKHNDPGDLVRSVAVGSVWVPVYSGAIVEGTTSAQRGAVTESILNFKTTDKPDRVLAYYETALKKGIFQFDTVTKNTDGGRVRSVLHQGKTTVLVTVLTAGDGSRGEIRTIDTSVDKDTRN